MWHKMSIFTSLFLLFSFLTFSCAQNSRGFHQGLLQCPNGFREDLFTFNEPFALTKEQNQIIQGGTDHACFLECKERQTCVAAIFDAGENRCALAHIDEQNIQLVCQEFENKPQFDRSRKNDQLNCSTGCQAMRKVCDRCHDTPLSVVTATVFCQGTFASIPEFCRGEQVVPVTKKPPTDIQEANIDFQSDNGVDGNIFCCFWAKIGECHANPFWMRPNCQFSCGTPGCRVETALSCEVTVNVAQCAHFFVAPLFPSRTRQPVAGIFGRQPHSEVRKHTLTDIENLTSGAEECKDLHPDCDKFAEKGRCEEWKDYVKANCRKSCRYC